jgi:hypothetical protein
LVYGIIKVLNDAFYIKPLFCLSPIVFIPFVFGPKAFFNMFKKLLPPLVESFLVRKLLPKGFGLYVAELLNPLKLLFPDYFLFILLLADIY